MLEPRGPSLGRGDRCRGGKPQGCSTFDMASFYFPWKMSLDQAGICLVNTRKKDLEKGFEKGFETDLSLVGHLGKLSPYLVSCCIRYHLHICTYSY